MNSFLFPRALKKGFALPPAALCLAALLVLALSAPAPCRAAPPGRIMVIPISGEIDRSTADFLAAGLARAARENARCAIVTLDTPGGYLDSMHFMVEDILASTIPVVVYISPAGASAASAGTLVALAADVVAMSPGTNIGAAHPVDQDGEPLDGVMDQKVTNDMVASARSVCEKRGRNPDWAERAIRQNESATADDAMDESIIDLLAPSLAELVKKLDGREIPGKGVLKTRGAVIETAAPSKRDLFFAGFADPNIASVLFWLGFLGVAASLLRPGLVLPGVAGLAALVLSLLSMDSLPPGAAGLILVLLALLLFFLEIRAGSGGALAVGGLACLALGCLMFLDPEASGIPVTSDALLPSLAALLVFLLLLSLRAARAQVQKPLTGPEAMIGEEATVRKTDGSGLKGIVFVRAELWDARFEDPVMPGDTVRILNIGGRTLTARRMD